ncbi:MAG: hypothetical protein CUN56_14015 [Phototrophicales bacterium]|nr:MAG: hypothetical protein CUN56_14015 [Phototrophicales bacterium]RMG72505.1 MAG: hypothetical protein D6711_12810 [Chloroflexota bacterium]
MINPRGYIRGFVLLFILFGAVAGCAMILATFATPQLQVIPTEAAPTPTELVGCTFIVDGDIMAYTAPFSDPILESTVLNDGEVYVVLERRPEHLLINIRGNYNVWVDRDDGTLNGFCTALPRNEQLIKDFPTVCSFTLNRDTMLYPNPALNGAGVPAQSDDIFVITRQSDTAYYVASEDGRAGWVIQSAGERAGACGAIPR